MYLNSHSNYSLRYGTLSPEELVDSAKRLGIRALALTDVNNTSAASEFVRRCKGAGIKPMLGIDFFKKGRRLYTGLARNAEGFCRLNRFLSRHSMEGKPLPATFPPAPDIAIVYDHLIKPIGQFESHEYLGIRPEHVHRLFSSPVKKCPDRLLMFSPITFLDQEGYELHKVLRAIDLNTVLPKLGAKDLARKTEMPVPPAAFRDFYKLYPKIIENTRQLAASCNIDLETGLRVNRQNFTGSKAGDFKLLEKLSAEGFRRRYAGRQPAVQERMQGELKVIRQMDFCTYFLITWDIVRYASAAGYHHVGRGSGANSIVAYCLGITDVDPVELDLYFERFINKHRPSPPDFDIDFSWDERDDVTDYIFKRYGPGHTALLATYSTFQFNAAIREVGKVHGLPKAEIDRLGPGILKATGTSDVQYWKHEHPKFNLLPQNQNGTAARAGADQSLYRSVLSFARKIIGFPNHLSIHAGGVLISEKPIFYHTALRMMPKGFPVTHFDMHHAEELGFHKFDVLSQRGLGHIKDTVDLVKANQGKAIDIRDIAKIKADGRVRAQLKSGNCLGCFYVESPAMRGLLKKLRCSDYKHLVAASSIIRPGVAKSGMMKEYIRRFHEPHGFKYLHPVFEEHLGETFGVMVYQEDVMKIVHHFAGLGLAESDVLRRLMSGKKKKGDQFENLKKKYFGNCRKRGHPEALSKEVWRQIESFAGYSFCKAHSASFAVESFQSLYLKAYFPLEFMVAVINNFGGFYRTEYYFHEAKMNGANVHAPCVNKSLHLTTIKGKDIYAGFVHISQLERATSHKIIHQRAIGGPFLSLADFVSRVDILSLQLDILIRVGAFRFTGTGKCALMWKKNSVFNPREKFECSGRLFDDPVEHFELPQLKEGPFDQAFDEIELLGFPLSCTPFDLLENNALAAGGIAAAQMPGCIGRLVVMVGYYVTRKDVRTVKKELMFFGTWLDRDGHFFDTVHFPAFVRRSPFRGKGVYRIEGRVTEEYGFPSLEVVKMERLAFRQDERYGS
ncbi:MAG TPA: DNA polymerase III subunit alpha [Bacteroidetes bacterium]|nr:DNA polymerase III subunit alpha [Bacteroidota bacterium]